MGISVELFVFSSDKFSIGEGAKSNTNRKWRVFSPLFLWCNLLWTISSCDKHRQKSSLFAYVYRMSLWSKVKYTIRVMEVFFHDSPRGGYPCPAANTVSFWPLMVSSPTLRFTAIKPSTLIEVCQNSNNSAMRTLKSQYTIGESL